MTPLARPRGRMEGRRSRFINCGDFFKKEELRGRSGQPEMLSRSPFHYSHHLPWLWVPTALNVLERCHLVDGNEVGRDGTVLVHLRTLWVKLTQGPSLVVTQLQAGRAHCRDRKPGLPESGDRLLRVRGSWTAQVLGCLGAIRQQFSFSAEHRDGEASRKGLQQAGLKLDPGQTRVSCPQMRTFETRSFPMEAILGSAGC